MSYLLSDKQLNQVKDFISLEMLKRGYSAKIVKFEEHIDTNDDERGKINFISESFQTTPVMFKELCVCSLSSGTNKDFHLSREFNKEIGQVYVEVGVRYRGFDNSSNCTSLFTMRGSFLKGGESVEDIVVW